jgi:hypothetical protein
LVENLRYSWLSQNNDGQAEPATSLSGLSSVAFVVASGEGELLRVCNDAPFDVWVNLKLVMSGATNCITFELDSLQELVSTDSLFFHIQSLDGVRSLSTDLMRLTVSETDDIRIQNRVYAVFGNYYLSVLAVCLLLLASTRYFYGVRVHATLSNPFRATASIEDDYCVFGVKSKNDRCLHRRRLL